MNVAFVYAGARTPFGRIGGALAGIRPDDLVASVVSTVLGKAPALAPGRMGEFVPGHADGPAGEAVDPAEIGIALVDAEHGSLTRYRNRRADVGAAGSVRHPGHSRAHVLTPWGVSPSVVSPAAARARSVTLAAHE